VNSQETETATEAKEVSARRETGGRRAGFQHPIRLIAPTRPLARRLTGNADATRTLLREIIPFSQRELRRDSGRAIAICRSRGSFPRICFPSPRWWRSLVKGRVAGSRIQATRAPPRGPSRSAILSRGRRSASLIDPEDTRDSITRALVYACTRTLASRAAAEFGERGNF